MLGKLLLALALILAPVQSIKAGQIKPENRVPNVNVGIGLCWFCCLEMIGRENNMPRLYDLREWVTIDGTGRDIGASREDMVYWFFKTNTPYAFNSDKTNDAFLTAAIENGFTPIVGITIPFGYDKFRRPIWGNHAIVLTDIYEAADGKWYVKFIDPNTIAQEQWRSWAWFKGRWNGDAHIIGHGKWFPQKATEVNPH